MFYKMTAYCLAAMLWVTDGFAGQLTASVEPQRIQFGDTVRLEVSYEGQDSGLIQPKFDVLNEDFAIYSTSTSMQSQYVNGVGQQKRIWNLTLMPQKEGKLTIPEITAGNYKTVPLNIEVLPSGSSTVKTANTSATAGQNAAASADTADFWIELSVDTKEPYVQQEINGTLVIYDNKNIQFTDDPVFENAEDWEIKQIGDPVITNKNGQRVIKIKYAFFPQKSGRLPLPRILVKGYYIERKPSEVTHSVNGFLRFFDINFDVADLTGQQKPVMLKTKSANIEVKPVPSDYGNDWWLPSTNVMLKARWTDERPVFKVGEAVTREITLIAAGVAENQLPVLDFAPSEAWKQYPENPVFNSMVENGELVSVATTRVVYIPQRGGAQIIPEIRLRWYNVKTHHIEKAVIPAEEMYVGGVVNALPSQPDLQPSVTAEPSADTAKVPEKTAEDKPTHRDILLIAAIVLCAFLCGVVCNYLLLRRRIADPDGKTGNDTVQDIEKSLRLGDYRALRDSLLRWGEKVYTDTYINNLNDLSAQVKAPEFAEQMRILNGNLYAGNTEKLDAEIILKCVKNRQKNKLNPKQPPLPDLYK